MTPTGHVAWYSKRLGYGFVAQEDGGSPVFVHHSGLSGTGFLEEGDRVAYRIVERRGGQVAVEVEKLAGEADALVAQQDRATDS